MKRRLFSGLFAISLVLASNTSAQTPAAKPLDGKAAFEKLKALAGTWAGPINAANGPKGVIKYEVVSGGSVVMEVLFPGQPHEMRSMYTVDKGELILTHYCSAGNQPRMRMSKTASTADKIVFDFDGGTGFDASKDMHIHSGEITFLPDGKLEANWNAWVGGKPQGSNHFFALTKEQ
jgi:hypothetical protein